MAKHFGVDCMPLLDISDRVTELMKPFKDGSIPVEVLSNIEGIPALAGGPAYMQKSYGLTYNNSIYLFADNLRSIDDAQKTLFHEMFHFWLRRFLTKEQYVLLLST